MRGSPPRMRVLAATLLCPATLTVLASGCGSNAAHGLNRAAARRCVERWNRDLKHWGPEETLSKSELAATSVDVNTIGARCVVIFSIHGRHVVFVTAASRPRRNKKDFHYEGATRRNLKASFQAQNALMDSHDRLTLRAQ